VSKTGSLGPLAVAAVVIAVIFNPALSRKGNGAVPPAEAGQAPSAHSSAGRASSEDDDIDTLDTIGESLAVDLSTEGLKRRANWSLRILESGAGNATRLRNAVGFLRAFFELRLHPGEDLETAKAGVTRLGEEYTKDASSRSAQAIQQATNDVRRFLPAYFDRSAPSDENATKEAVLRARDFELADKTNLKIALLGQVLHDRGSRVEFLIATLPDPIDSYTGWQFDPMLDAITQAVAASSYVLDRFHFPDSDKEQGSASQRGEQGRLHELEPGVVIFRKQMDSEFSYGERLVLLIVHENPAAGVHARALANAVKLVIDCRDLTKDVLTEGGLTKPPIRILGPTFSGSSESLNRALHLVKNRVDRGYRVRVVSGSATDRQNKKIIESQFSNLEVNFSATVHPDDLLMPRLASQIRGTESPSRVAVLFEANTQYGRQLWKVLSNHRTKNNLPLELIQLPFPMNVSRLRTTIESQDPAHTGPLGLPSRFRPLPMETHGNPSDQIPQFNPKTTATYVELAVAGMLDTMHREQVKNVALLATDPRDKLFLAQQIARYSPDVSILTAESDSIYVHPDYSSYLRGAIVVSTYPLFSANQRWSYGYQGDTERRQFANGSAQGIYNAAIALLAYNEDGSAAIADPPRLLEYGFPAEPCPDGCTPPVWISVIGRSGAWPVRAYRVGNASDYVFPVSSSEVPVSPRVFPSATFHALLILLTFAIVVAWLAQWKPGFMAPAVRQPSSSTGRAGQHEGPVRAYLLVCLVGVLLIQTFIFMLCLIRIWIGDASSWAIMARVVSAVGVVAACHVTARVLAAILREHRRSPWNGPNWRHLSTWWAVGAALVCAWSAANLVLYLREYATGERSSAVSFLARALDFESGVSPTLPVLFLGSALTLWGFTELSRVRLGRVALADASVHPLLQQMVYADVQKLKSAWDLLNRSILRVPPGGIAVAAFIFLATCIFVFDPFQSWLVTIEGQKFGRFVSSTLLLVQVMLSLALVQFVYLWSRIKELLDLLVRHHLAGAFERIPRELFPRDLFPRSPRLVDLQIPVAHCRRLMGAGTLVGSPVWDMPAQFNLDTTFQEEVLTAPDTPWATSSTWHELLNAAWCLADRLRAECITGPAAQGLGAHLLPSKPERGKVYKPVAVAELVAVDQAALPSEEELPAMLVTLVLRDALVRLAQNLIFVIGGVVLMFCSYTLFPFQQHTQLQVLGWIYIGITFTTILTVLVQIKRNEIVASLTSTAPGIRTTWDGAFILKVVVFALLPLFALFATQFPEIGGLLLRWIEPVQRALP
jgi:hypothetical protein